MLGLALLTLSGCGDAFEKDQLARIGMPEPATETAPFTLELWQWAWVAAIATGVLVWGLIFYTVWRFRRRHDDDIPVQTRYNLPLEIFYTIAPIMMVVVFFYWTVDVQNKLVDLDPEPDLTVDVVGQKWSWTFNYTDQGEGGRTPYTAGSGSQIPTLVLPVDETVQFNLQSPDVVHDFGVDAFLFKMDVIPGRINRFQVTPTKIGDYNGKCYELCGTYHARMIFDVKVVSKADYDAYLEDLADEGFIADQPLLGGADARTQAGLEDDAHEEGGSE
ncbi:cytochrome c oxidase subunit II [Nocardioides sp. LHG3406-4]|uniref:aa3-type cytochrome oxidase subunit II n=1 Tax=Nocardioides sp. LHG3406-4 TaxID=2804575 RepID=UPI003CED42C5